MTLAEQLANRVYHKDADVLMELCGYAHGLIDRAASAEQLQYLCDIGLLDVSTNGPTPLGLEVAALIYMRA